MKSDTFKKPKYGAILHVMLHQWKGNTVILYYVMNGYLVMDCQIYVYGYVCPLFNYNDMEMKGQTFNASYTAFGGIAGFWLSIHSTFKTVTQDWFL